VIEIDGHIVSTDIITTRFCCDLAACKGICCVEGNSGAPLEVDEVAELEAAWEAYRFYMKPSGIAAVEAQGFSVTDEDGDLTTTLIDGAECAYSFQENGVTLCAIEKAWKEGLCSFRKPISCHLYPIRLAQFSNGSIGLNYHRWSVCRPALINGAEAGIPIYRALREPIVRRFGEEFFKALEHAEEYLKDYK
jgi:hypothetical protein